MIKIIDGDPYVCSECGDIHNIWEIRGDDQFKICIGGKDD